MAEEDSAVDVFNLHPNWDHWSPDPNQASAVSINAKLMENNHQDVQKCIIDPREARALSNLQGVPSEMGFWLLPPRRAPQHADVRLFLCGDRCAEAGTVFIIPEYQMGYPAAKGSIVLIKRGVGYGLGVTDADVFDKHVEEGKECCSKLVVMLRSTQAGGEEGEMEGMAVAVEDDLEYIRAKTAVGPQGLLGKPLTSKPLSRIAPRKSISSSGASSSVVSPPREGHATNLLKPPKLPSKPATVVGLTILAVLELGLSIVSILSSLPVLSLSAVCGGDRHRAAAIGVIGSELPGLFILLHVLFFVIFWFVGGYLWIIVAVFGLVVQLNLFVHGLVTASSAAQRMVDEFQRRLEAKYEPNTVDVGGGGDDQKKKKTICAPSPYNPYVLLRSFVTFWIPLNVTHLKDITYVTPEELAECGPKQEPKLQLDVLFRKNPPLKTSTDGTATTSPRPRRPIFMYIHGGAWQFGDKSKLPAGFTLPICYHMASVADWVVVNVNYRLVTKGKDDILLVDMLTDLRRALRWIRENGDVHGGDIDYIVVAGGSAGGHLAELITLEIGKEGVAGFKGPEWGAEVPSKQFVKACFGFYPVTHPLDGDVKHMEEFRDGVIGNRGGNGKTDEEWADPLVMLRGMSEDEKAALVPRVIVHGGNDVLVSIESVRVYVDELRKADVPTAFCELPLAHHGFPVFGSPRCYYATWAVGASLNILYEKRKLA
ncbi:hypothetical protein HK101_008053 [Irineochytrium annulatum]|nr:hypothetical protein HK101_008053 [Irineochytrium annulatum]